LKVKQNILVSSNSSLPPEILTQPRFSTTIKYHREQYMSQFYGFSVLKQSLFLRIEI